MIMMRLLSWQDPKAQARYTERWISILKFAHTNGIIALEKMTKLGFEPRTSLIMSALLSHVTDCHFQQEFHQNEVITHL
jgi:hypothetical protein